MMVPALSVLIKIAVLDAAVKKVANFVMFFGPFGIETTIGSILASSVTSFLWSPSSAEKRCGKRFDSMPFS